MGAFVGNVTSPFLRRRKGRIGKDVVENLIAPTFGGAALQVSAAQYDSIACSTLGNNDYQVSEDFGASAWINYTLPLAADGMGVSSNSTPMAARPWCDTMDESLWFLQGRYNGAGRNTGNGNSYEISTNGKISSLLFTVGGKPCDSFAWSFDGRCYLTAGSNRIDGVIACRGAMTDSGAGAPQSFNYNITAGNATIAIVPIQTNEDDLFYTFFASHGDSASINFRKIKTRKTFGSPFEISADINNPTTSVLRFFVQHNIQLLMGFGGSNAQSIRSIDNGETWSIVNIGGAGGVTGAMQYGSRIYAFGNTNPKIHASRNFGATWFDPGTVFPHAAAVIESVALRPFYAEVYLLAREGAVNRFYKFRPYMEI